MLYNNKGYTIEIPDELYWSMTDEEFNEYIDTKLIESYRSSESSPRSFSLPEEDVPPPQED